MIPRERYKHIVKQTQLIACDLLIKNNNKILMGKRLNAPAKGYLFNPGARMYKYETPDETIRRILNEECGVKDPKGQFLYLGTFIHKYPKENFAEPQESEEQTASFGTEYFTHAFVWDLDTLENQTEKQHILDILTNKHIQDEQHDGYFLWVPIQRIIQQNGEYQNTPIHPFVRKFFKDRNNMVQSFKIL